MPTSKVTVSLPAELLHAADRVRAARHYSRSELFREALRLYLLPTYEPTIEELRAIDDGLAEIERDETVELSELKHRLDLDSSAQ